MFFIGIFSSFIPYLVIAVIYLLGIGIYSLENQQHKACPSESDKQLVIEEIKKSAESNSADYFAYDNPDDFSAYYPPSFRHKTFSESGKKLFCFNHPALPLQIGYSVHFCRPPPVTYFS